MNYIISEKQLEKIVEYTNKNKISGQDTINEAWWNTIGDVVGIFDPTGIVDFVNGLDYIRQGDFAFGFLSMVAVIPGIGDLIAKPIIGAGKFTSLGVKLNKALALSKNAKSTDDLLQASKLLEEASKQNKLVEKFLLSVPQWGDKLKNMLLKAQDMIPGGKLTSGIRKMINGWIDLISEFAKRRVGARHVTANMAKKISKASLSDAVEITKKLREMKKSFSSSEKIFRNTQLKDPSFMVKYFWPGFTIRNKTNRELIGLMRRTKFFLGFLDFLGLGNWKGPEDLEKDMGTEKFDKQMVDYANSPQGQQYWKEDMSSLPNDDAASATEDGTDTKTQTTAGSGGDELSKFINTIFGT